MLNLCQLQKDGQYLDQHDIYRYKVEKISFLLGLIFESSEQVYTRSMCLVVDAECELVRKSHNAVRASYRPLQKHFTGSKLFINLQRVTGELLQDHVSFLGWPFQTLPESHLSPFLI